MNRPVYKRSWLIGIGILAIGVIGMALMIALRPEPPKTEPVKQSPLVATVQPEAREGRLVVRGTGTARPIREVSLVAEISGKVIDVSSALVSGGFFRQGQVLLRLDTTDYVNAVAIAKAEVTQRRFELLTAQEEVAVAREEWQRLQQRTGLDRQPDSTAMGSLVLKEPQLRAARARLKSAEARLNDARTRLARTRIVAPFNGRVRTKNADIGQFVGPGQPVASVYSTDAVEIVVPLSSRDAALMTDLWAREGGEGRGKRLPATVYSAFGGQQHQWDGYVDRTEGTLDVATRTINVVVRVPQPYRTAGRPPLMVGAFVEVELQGMVLDRYFALPREALREDDTVWVVAQDTLRIRPVEVVQEVGETVYVTDGIGAGDHVVTSPLAVMTDGMSVRVER
ncbi:MAG: efflux RND transporter periplasmic adaptor subunit [Rhodothermales bacterium]